MSAAIEGDPRYDVGSSAQPDLLQPGRRLSMPGGTCVESPTGGLPGLQMSGHAVLSCAGHRQLAGSTRSVVRVENYLG